MKSYDETINTVFDRIGEYEKTQKNRRKVITRTAASFCCVCLVALGCVGVLKKNSTPDEYVDDAVYPGIKDTFDDANKGEVSYKDYIIFNEISEKVPSEMGIALFRDDEVAMSKDEINEYFGVDIFPDCPDGLEEKTSRLRIYKRDKGTGDVYCDFNQIRYLNADNSKGFVVSVGTNSILYLTEYYLGDRYNDIEKSVINNIEILFAEIKSEKYYYAEFSYKGVMFSVYSENITQEEFISVISSLVTE